MFWLLIIALLALTVGFGPLFFIVGIAVIIVLIYFFFREKPDIPKSYETQEVTGLKISAAVSEHFYNEIKQYCRNHHMTVSDLIRKAVRDYMNENG